MLLITLTSMAYERLNCHLLLMIWHQDDVVKVAVAVKLSRRRRRQWRPTVLSAPSLHHSLHHSLVNNACVRRGWSSSSAISTLISFDVDRHCAVSDSCQVVLVQHVACGHDCAGGLYWHTSQADRLHHVYNFSL